MRQSRKADNSSTSGMKGEGYYDLHSEYQRRIIEGGDALIRAAAEEIDLDACGGTFTMADYGAGTGATSVHAVRTALGAVRDRDPDLPFLAIHNDVPSNDFTQVFANIAGREGYLGVPGGPVYATAAAGSFFTQVVPDASVNLGTCSNASHWFQEQRPQAIDAGMYFCEATGEARDALAAGAAADWLAFLSARSAELAPGGLFLVQGIGTVSAPDGSERASASRLLAAMWRAADELAGEGLLDRGVLETYVFPVYCRSPKEVAAPAAEGGALADRLDLVSVVVDEVPDPYWEAYERDGDPAAYAEVYTQFVRAFAESTLSSNLFEPGAVSIAAGELSDRYFAALEASIAADPAAGRYEAWVVRALFKRH
jgi:S-adenosylmethionine-dependent carboxyl methyltransferase